MAQSDKTPKWIIFASLVAIIISAIPILWWQVNKIYSQNRDEVISSAEQQDPLWSQEEIAAMRKEFFIENKNKIIKNCLEITNKNSDTRDHLRKIGSDSIEFCECNSSVYDQKWDEKFSEAMYYSFMETSDSFDEKWENKKNHSSLMNEATDIQIREESVYQCLEN